MKFAKWLFLIAGLYALVVMTPICFSEAQITRDMPPAILEKATYVIAVIVLYSQQRVAPLVAGFAGADLILGALFVVAFWRTRKTLPNQRTGGFAPAREMTGAE